jgi:hypothetical protein
LNEESQLSAAAGLIGASRTPVKLQQGQAPRAKGGPKGSRNSREPMMSTCRRCPLGSSASEPPAGRHPTSRSIPPAKTISSSFGGMKASPTWHPKLGRCCPQALPMALFDRSERESRYEQKVNYLVKGNRLTYQRSQGHCT